MRDPIAARLVHIRGVDPQLKNTVIAGAPRASVTPLIVVPRAFTPKTACEPKTQPPMSVRRGSLARR